MKELAALGSLLATAMLCGCGSLVSVKKLADVAPFPESCPVQVFERADPAPGDGDLVAQVSFGDRFGTAGGYECSHDVVRRKLNEEACKAGADAAKVVSESEPRLFGSGCYLLHADLYRLRRPAPAAAAAPRKGTDVVTRLKELQALRESGAITDAEFQKLKNQLLQPGQ
jgi:hypothetical protein